MKNERQIRFLVRALYKKVKETKDERYGLFYGAIDPDALEDDARRLTAGDLANVAHSVLRHNKEINGCEIVESYIAPVNFKIAETPVQKNSWVLTLKIADLELWREIESENFGGFEFLVSISDFETLTEESSSTANEADIADLKHSRDIERLIQIYQIATDRRASAAQEALLEIGEPSAAAVRELFLDESADSFKRIGAARMLVAICGRKSVDLLTSVLLDKNADGFTRTSITSILADIGDRRAATALQEIIIDEKDLPALRVFAGTALERLVSWERIDPSVREVITDIELLTKSYIPITSTQDAERMIEDGTYHFPFYGFLLYTEKDKDFARFVRSNWQWLHDLSGEQCLVSAFEDPKKWGEDERWKLYWRERIGSDKFNLKMMKSMELKPVDRNLAFRLADILLIKKTELPCIVFVDTDSPLEAITIPIVVDKTEYADFLKDLFTVVTSAAQAEKGRKLRSLKTQWRVRWALWKTRRGAKLLQGKIMEWGSVLKEFDEAADIIAFLIKWSPLLAAIAVYSIHVL
jgi:hypothetical protein